MNQNTMKMNMRRRTTRQASNIFEMLTKSQIQELREAFNILDTNQDGTVDLHDLVTITNSIGNPFTPEEIDKMSKEANENGEFGNGMSFRVFLTMIGERLALTDDEKTIVKAFRVFSENRHLYSHSKGFKDNEEDGFNDGLWANKDLLKHYLTSIGDKLTEEEADLFMKGCIEGDFVDCVKLTSVIKHGEVVTKE